MHNNSLTLAVYMQEPMRPPVFLSQLSIQSEVQNVVIVHPKFVRLCDPDIAQDD